MPVLYNIQKRHITKQTNNKYFRLETADIAEILIHPTNR